MTKAQSLRGDFEKAVTRLDETLALPKDPIAPSPFPSLRAGPLPSPAVRERVPSAARRVRVAPVVAARTEEAYSAALSGTATLGAAGASGFGRFLIFSRKVWNST